MKKSKRYDWKDPQEVAKAFWRLWILFLNGDKQVLYGYYLQKDKGLFKLKEYAKKNELLIKKAYIYDTKNAKAEPIIIVNK